MTHAFVPVGWNRFKILYDTILFAGIVLYLSVYRYLDTRTDPQTSAIRAYGTLAFLMLTLILCIGPLCRLDRRFLPLLYNRRHFGVMMCAVAAGHAANVLDWYFAYSRLPPVEALLTVDTSFAQLQGFPFLPFGIAAFLILCALAFTSHDFWLAYLSPPVWKALHMAVYAAYALVVLHLAFGALQAFASPVLPAVTAVSVLLVTGLQVVAARREIRIDAGYPSVSPEPPWFDVAGIADIADGAGIVVHVPDGEPVAIFRDGNRIGAVSNLCAHQNGPLGEGRILDGCITCPWHGFQYRLEDGCAPPPFTEKIATYRLRRVGQRIWLHPAPYPPGTPVEPVQADVLAERVTG